MQDIMSEDEYESPEALQAGGNAGSGRQQTPSHRKGPRFSWTPAYEATFFRSLCESVKMGLKDNHSFKTEAWDRACQALAERHAAYPNKGHLINKSDNARKKFRLWRGLREDPEFLYNPNTKTVTASDEAWRAHIEREPLSKSLRNRPFEHEQFLEILFPDVIGSGGAPKRITKPRRKGLDAMADPDDLDTPGTNVMNLLSPVGSQNLFQTTSQTPILPPTVPSNGTIRPSSTTLPPRASIASSSALTPPDEDAPQQASHTRKRFLPSNNGPVSAEKRRRTANNSGSNYMDLNNSAQLLSMDQPQDLGNIAPPMSNNSSTRQANSQPNINGHAATAGPSTGAAATRQHLFQDAMISIGEILRNNRNTPPTPRWTEQAMETFFRDFADEDMDLQIKIGEKVLADANKAMMFCLMPEQVRQHWVKRLRELHNRMDGSAGLNSNNNAANNAMAAANNNLNPATMNGTNGMNGMGGLGAGMMQMGGPINGGMGRNGSQVG